MSYKQLVDINTFFNTKGHAHYGVGIGRRQNTVK